MKYIFLVLIFCSSAYANTERTFSCNGGYESNEGNPVNTIHVESVYVQGDISTDIVLKKNDLKVELKATLKIVDEEEFLEIQVRLKESGIRIFNNNSGLGQKINGDFNFVSLGLKNIGNIEYRGNSIEVKKASFQCQTYKN